ncbi:hypothetical protein TRIUR3_07957 [Triticum urartu]|uniref:Uncharacterized protein n=2 Tax=Triticum TaxID=4564 RepID=A0A9R0RGQ2_TRITD|nr:hypothetical protein TRIUR3_07957 [Triticum urartu]VAH59598.1 unnamed protein product [Triticum turgidum subsp. durum]
MARVSSALFLAMVALVLAVPALAGDPDYLQDICVADLKSDLKVNGFPCKANATADDFFTGVLAKPGATNTTAGSVVTGANVEKVPDDVLAKAFQIDTVEVDKIKAKFAPKK